MTICSNALLAGPKAYAVMVCRCNGKPLVSAAIVVLWVRPLLQTLQGLQKRRDILLSFQRSAPALERPLNQAET